MVGKDSKELSQDQDFVQKYQKLVRPCDQYKAEYKECKKIRSRFHQYFIDGETKDCNAWYHDYENCNKWNKEQDVDAFKKILVSETVRKLDRFKPHYDNDVWEKRESPPEWWNSDPPEWFKEHTENTFLAMKRDEELLAKSNPAVIPAKSSCVIS